MRNNKSISRSELKVGMKVKLPINGSFFGKRKKALWFKGTIKKVSYKFVDKQTKKLVMGVLVSLRTGHGYNDMGTWLILGEDIDYIYKQL